MSAESRVYSLYGLRIRSAIALPCPEWHGDALSADVHLRESTQAEIDNACISPPAQVDKGVIWECRQFSDGAARISWKDHFDFFVSGDGTLVLWQRLVGVPNEVLFTYLLNQVLSYCLLARGIEPLHATSIVIDGKAIALLGDTGYGKSTLAAEFVRRGYPLLTDDVLVLDLSGDEILGYPSLPRLKLVPESADAVLGGRRALPMNTFTTKMILPLAAAEHAATRVPIRAMFALPANAKAARVSIRRASNRQALLLLVKNTFNAAVFSHRRLERQFHFAGRLANAVPVKLLSFPRGLQYLPSVADTMLDHLAASRGDR